MIKWALWIPRAHFQYARLAYWNAKTFSICGPEKLMIFYKIILLVSEADSCLALASSFWCCLFGLLFFSVGEPWVFWSPLIIFWISQKALIPIPIDTLNISAALVGMTVASGVSTLLEGNLKEPISLQVMRCIMKKVIHESGSLFFHLEKEALYILLFWFLTALREGGLGQKKQGCRYSGKRKQAALSHGSALRPALHPDFFPAARALWETGFRSLTHVSLSGPSC